MKALLMIFAITGFAYSVNAQAIKESKVPAPVVSAFQKMYPSITDVDWSVEDGNYEAEYDMNKMEASVTFDANGNLVETEKEIDISQLPKGIAEYVSKNYGGVSIKEASEITDKKGIKTYEAEIKGKDLIFDASGKFIREEKD